LRIAYAKLYRRKTLENSLSFLKELYNFFDCRIQSILTDNGLEFTNIRGVPGSHILDEFCLKNSGKQNSQRKEGKRMNGKVERCERGVRELWEKSSITHFYESLEDMEEGLRTYVELL